MIAHARMTKRLWLLLAITVANQSGDPNLILFLSEIISRKVFYKLLSGKSIMATVEQNAFCMLSFSRGRSVINVQRKFL